jgi:hypothetical protein
VNITNHRTRISDLDRLVDEVLVLGRGRTARAHARPSGRAPVRDDTGLFPGGADVPLEILLSSGGDSRLCVDAATGLSRYGCSPKPRPRAIALASTTASSISCGARDHVEATRQSLMRDPSVGGPGETLSHAMDEMRQEIGRACGALPGTEILLTASGTEIVALFLALSASPAPVTNIVVGPAEIGTHSPLAADGRHFDSLSPLGIPVDKGALVDPFFAGRVAVVDIHVRRDDGRTRPSAEIDREVEDAVEAAVASGRRVLLHVIDVSKTGLIAPRLETVVRLMRRHPTSVDVVVDACQMRLAPATLRAYGKAGFLIMISGSKFLTGPPFAGALLVPASIGARVAGRACLPAGLGAYSCKEQWPRAWGGIRHGLPVSANVGLLLRWQAALWESRRFAEVPGQEVHAILSRLAHEMELAVAARPYLGLLDTRKLDRGPFNVADAWDVVPTIFTFTVSADGQLLGERELARIHDWMNQDISELLPPDADESARGIAATCCHLGRPVCVARTGLGEVTGLRVSASARMVASIAFDSTLGATIAERITRVVGDVRCSFEKLDLVVASRTRLATLTKVSPGAAGPTRP